MNPKEVFHNTAYSVQLPYIAGHSLSCLLIFLEWMKTTLFGFHYLPIVADGVVYASRDLKADIIVDIATLTGAQVLFYCVNTIVF